MDYKKGNDRYPDEYYSVSAAAKFLGISRQAVNQHKRKAHIIGHFFPNERNGKGSWKFTRQELEEFVLSSTYYTSHFRCEWYVQYITDRCEWYLQDIAENKDK